MTSTTPLPLTTPTAGYQRLPLGGSRRWAPSAAPGKLPRTGSESTFSTGPVHDHLCIGKHYAVWNMAGVIRDPDGYEIELYQAATQ